MCGKSSCGFGRFMLVGGMIWGGIFLVSTLAPLVAQQVAEPFAAPGVVWLAVILMAIPSVRRGLIGAVVPAVLPTVRRATQALQNGTQSVSTELLALEQRFPAPEQVKEE